jgi:iron complex outermembrane receptor protein
LAWGISDNWSLRLGGSNVFDEYPDEIADDGVFANRISVGLPYPRLTVTNYEGGSL